MKQVRPTVYADSLGSAVNAYHREVARNLVRIYADVLHEPVPETLRKLASRIEPRHGGRVAGERSGPL